MRIMDVEVLHLRMDTIRDEANGTQDAAIIRVHTDAGLIGLGEADSSPHVVKAIIDAPRSHSIMAGIRELIVGEDPLLVRRLWQKMYDGTLYFGRRGAALHAISGVDIALWDLAGKALGQPVHTLLGGAVRKQIRAYASALFAPTPAETAEKARRYLELGFTAMKFGWGNFGQDAERDIAQIRAIRDTVGPRVDVMVDAGTCWDAATAAVMARRLAELDVFWLEEPLHPDDLAGYALLTAISPIRIAAGEEDASVYAFEELIERGGVAVVQPDVSRAGGLTESLRIAELAHRRGRNCVPHNFSTGILTAASLHLNAVIPRAIFQEFPAPGEGSPLNVDLVTPRFDVRDGYLSIPTAPGLGVVLAPEVVQRYQVE
jgi:L-alanine-DL-glutamate epimerase-like enolase superfamily enzyme